MKEIMAVSCKRLELRFSILSLPVANLLVAVGALVERKTGLSTAIAVHLLLQVYVAAIYSILLLSAEIDLTGQHAIDLLYRFRS